MLLIIQIIIKVLKKIDSKDSKEFKTTSPITIEESWGKHLYWPRPNTNKRIIKKQVKLSFTVTAIEWTDHYSKKDKEKLLKEKKT